MVLFWWHQKAKSWPFLSIPSKFLTLSSVCPCFQILTTYLTSESINLSYSYNKMDSTFQTSLILNKNLRYVLSSLGMVAKLFGLSWFIQKYLHFCNLWLFKNTVSGSYNTALNNKMINRLKNVEGSSRGLRYYPNICLEELWKTIKNLRQDSQSLDQDLNQRPHKYEVWVPATWRWHSVHLKVNCHVMLCYITMESTASIAMFITLEQRYHLQEGGWIGVDYVQCWKENWCGTGITRMLHMMTHYLTRVHAHMCDCVCVCVCVCVFVRDS
jgi:hypothetical protein